MAPIIEFIFGVVDALIAFLIFVLIVNAILSWLVMFDVINLRNRAVYNFARALDAISRPVLRPVQRFIPPLGGIDISPVIVIIVLSVARSTLLPGLETFLLRLVG